MSTTSNSTTNLPPSGESTQPSAKSDIILEQTPISNLSSTTQVALNKSEGPEKNPSVNEQSDVSYDVEDEFGPPPRLMVVLFSPHEEKEAESEHFPDRPLVRPWDEGGQPWYSWRALAWAFSVSERIIFSDPYFTKLSKTGSFEEHQTMSPLLVRNHVESFLVTIGIMAQLTKAPEAGKWIEGIIGEIKKLSFPLRVAPSPFDIWVACRLSASKAAVSFRYDQKGQVTTAELVRAFLIDNPDHPFGEFLFEESNTHPANKKVINRASQKLNKAVTNVFTPKNSNVRHVTSSIPRLVDGLTVPHSGFVGLELKAALGKDWKNHLSPNQKETKR